MSQCRSAHGESLAAWWHLAFVPLYLGCALYHLWAVRFHWKMKGE